MQKIAKNIGTKIAVINFAKYSSIHHRKVNTKASATTTSIMPIWSTILNLIIEKISLLQSWICHNGLDKISIVFSHISYFVCHSVHGHIFVGVGKE